MPSPKKVLITGVYGLIAGRIYTDMAELPGQYEVHALSRREQPSERAPGERGLAIPKDRSHLADLTDLDAVRKAVSGCDTVIQMAADPRPEAPWESTLNSNMIGVYNVFEASRLEGVKRIVYASSVMASWGNQFDEPYKAIKECRFADVPDPIPLIKHTDPPRPTEPYSASKVWGEALARTYSDSHGMSCLCVRIGWVNAQDIPDRPELAAVWCSQRDIVDITLRCANAPDDLRFDIFYGISKNRYCWLDMSHPKEVLGFEARDSAEERLSKT